MAISLSMKALPVLAAILGEMGLFGERISHLALGAAGVNDIALWVLLGILLTVAAAGHAGRGLPAVWLLALAPIYLFLMVRYVRPVLARMVMLAHDLPLGDDDDALGIHPHADRTIGERRRHAVAIAVQMDQARRRHALGVFDEAVERARKLHQAPDFFCPYRQGTACASAVALGQFDQGSQIGRIDDNRFKVGRVCQVVLEPPKGFARREDNLVPTRQPPERRRGCDGQEINERADGVRVGF